MMLNLVWKEKRKNRSGGGGGGERSEQGLGCGGGLPELGKPRQRLSHSVFIYRARNPHVNGAVQV